MVSLIERAAGILWDLVSRIILIGLLGAFPGLAVGLVLSFPFVLVLVGYFPDLATAIQEWMAIAGALCGAFVAWIMNLPAKPVPYRIGDSQRQRS